MEYADIPQSFDDAESFGFLAVPIPFPPMIEDAFRYCGRERYVTLGFGVRGGVMSDFVGDDSRRPRSRYVYRSFLTHPAMKPYTKAFQIETDPPSWLEGLKIDDCEDARNNLTGGLRRAGASCLIGNPDNFSSAPLRRSGNG